MDPEAKTDSGASTRVFLNGALSIESIPYPREEKPKQRKRKSCSCLQNKPCEAHSKSAPEPNPVQNSLTTSALLGKRPSTVSEIEENKKPGNKLPNKELAREKEALLEQIKKKEKQMNTERDKENFKKWLAKKKQLEVKELSKQKEIEKKAADKEQEKLFRSKQSEMAFKLWSKKKEEEELKRKLAEIMDELKISDEKESRKEMSKVAYEKWLKKSKNKALQLCSGQGFDTLPASAYVTFVNPLPWQPNIDVETDERKL